MDIASMYRDMLIFFALVKRLRETGKWVEFRTYADGERIKEAWKRTGIDDLDVWLLDPARFAGLVAEWPDLLKEER
jgi:predicted helicase